MNLSKEAHQEAKAKAVTSKKTRATFVPSKRTYAGSQLFSTGKRTETSFLDAGLAIAAEAIASGTVEDVNVLQVVDIIAEIGRDVSVARIRDHVAKNAYHKEHTKFTEDGDLLLSPLHRAVHA